MYVPLFFCVVVNCEYSFFDCLYLSVSMNWPFYSFCCYFVISLFLLDFISPTSSSSSFALGFSLIIHLILNDVSYIFLGCASLHYTANSRVVRC